MAECVTLYRKCFHTVWVYLPESLLHGGVCYTVSRVFGCIYLRASCMAECVTLYSECLGVSTWEPPAWRSALHCIASVWVYLPESLLHGGVRYTVSRVFGCIYLRASCMAECVTLYRECLGVSTWEPPAWRSVLHCIASVWVYLPESLLHGGVRYTVSRVFGCIYLRASCMAECVTLYRECLGVSTWEHPAWRSALHCIASVWVYLPESLLHGGVCYTVSRVFSHCLGVSTWEPPAWRSALHCITSVWVYLPESLLHGGVRYTVSRVFGCIYLRASCMAECVTLYSECLGVSTWEPPAWRSVLHCIASVFTLFGCIYLRASCMAECVTLYHECLGVSTWEPPAWRSALHCIASVWVYLPESLLHGGVRYTV